MKQLNDVTEVPTGAISYGTNGQATVTQVTSGGAHVVKDVTVGAAENDETQITGGVSRGRQGARAGDHLQGARRRDGRPLRWWRRRTRNGAGGFGRFGGGGGGFSGGGGWLPAPVAARQRRWRRMTLTPPDGTPSGRGQPVIDLERVTKVYRTGTISVAALRGVSLSIDQGEYVAIIGPSGSGKSTLMHILGCLDIPTSGRYHLAGEDVSHMSETALAEVRNRRIGFVFQQFNLLASMTAWQNVELPLVYAGVPRGERKERAMAALGRVGLAGRVNHRPGELSGGQQQRVAVARALVTEPDLILADEPTGNLDSKSAADVMRLMAELHDAGRTLVLITHDVEVASAAGSGGRDPRRVADRQRPAVSRERAMSWLETIRTGVNGVRSHRLRSFLTVLGILIGIAGVIIAVGLGEGASGQVTSEINALGLQRADHHPGQLDVEHRRPGGAGDRLDPDHGRRLGAGLPGRRSRRQGRGRHHLVERGAHRRERDGDDHGAGDDAVLVDRAGPHRGRGPLPRQRGRHATTRRWVSWARRPPRSCSAGRTRSGRRST